MKKKDKTKDDCTCPRDSSDKEDRTEDNTEDTCCPQSSNKDIYEEEMGDSLRKAIPTIIMVMLFTIMIAVTFRLVCEWMGFAI